jgi:prevent-host-death family protein
MEKTISATEARIKFGQLMRRVVESDEAVIVERDGKPQVVILSIDHYEHLKGGNGPWELWEAKLSNFHERLRADLGGRQPSSSVDVVRQMREERDERLAGLR